MTKVRIFVTYKKSVFDPQGETIKEAIHSLNHKEVTKVQVGKFFDVTINDQDSEIEKIIQEIAEQLLINVNMETYTYQVMGED
ncbi:phosphoribosylformylglycinamidine synthase subunit PurS [Lactobacillaceae bacterium 24-114]